MVPCDDVRCRCGRRWLGLVLGLWLMLVPGVQAQEAVPEFDVDMLGRRGPAPTREMQVDVYTRIPYTRLSFLNTPNGFTARYEVSARVVEVDERARLRNVVLSRRWEGKVVVPTYAATQQEELSDFTMQTLSLPPGRYVFEMQIEDRASNQVFVREVPFVVRDLNRPVAVSDISLLDAYDTREQTMTPRVTNRVGSDEMRFKVFYEVYTEQPGRSVRIAHEVTRLEKDSGLPAVRALFTETEAGGEVVYQKAEASRLDGRTNQFIVDIPMEEGKVGTYVLRVRVEDEQGRPLDVAERVFTVRWTGLHEHIRNLDEAIAQLEYIAKKKELDYIRSAPTEDERYRRFMAFWEKRDPTPGTRRNERMEEYYYRVAYANERYRHLINEGWKTDRGYVMIRFGEPDAIDRHPYSFNAKPYEVWYYYRIGRRFIFIDETGLGDYKLLVPVWDERTRIR
ncbi:GWxTD domain-containing protein [Rhodocaloribacter litoris]|uniref:GWxTD domain-containing protein n=1 Tax=Rhodocaloribacter litoris TaxID=2558931 RepID=UPI00141DF0F3|nr:GWxTD domain-containing protein [Rhodocaloribacter litoris]QXD16428.1 GWxTD domain-containing protein [Rhodocaloribacter litoris]